jgi:GH43 family beta-xylosidase
VYYAAAHPTHGNKSHRMYVLGGPPATEDPGEGQWEFLGRIHGMPDHWAIDGTIVELNQNLYFIYSGWPLDDASESDLIQQIFIMKLSDPTTAASKPSIISAPELPWEFTRDEKGEHGINEGPQFLESPDKSWRGIVYSCGGSWTSEYKMAVLHYNHGDPLDPRSWPKGQEPLLRAYRYGQGPWGPGHGSFVALGEETLCIFHGTDSPTDGWANRKARCQRVVFTESGPFMGLYCAGKRSQASRSGLIGRLQRSLSKRIKEAGLQPRKDNTLRTLLESN